MTEARFTTGSVVKYAFLPRIFPRFGQLFLTGFHQVAFLMAQVYYAARLLPANHPFLLSANIGKFTIRQVIAAAANNIQFRRENIDQIIVFFALLMGLILLVAQVLLMLSSLFVPAAMAAGTPLSFGTYFGTPTYNGLGSAQDLAFILLDRVFGVPGIFDSCVSTGVPCNGTLPDLSFDAVNTVYAPAAFPWPYHDGLHAMLEFYSVGLLVVATFIILYFIIVIVAETAQTGTPFGKRFNSVWAPLRLVMALGLLIPITNGLNSAQYLVLYMAKFGSNFASNGWVWYNAAVQAWGANQAIQMVAKPQVPETKSLLQFMMLAHACKALEEGMLEAPTPKSADAAGGCAGLHPQDDGRGLSSDKENYVDAYLVRIDLVGADDARRLSHTTYNDALAFFENQDMTIRFGDRDCDNVGYKGRVAPTCGEVLLPITTGSNNAADIGARRIQEGYYVMIQYLWGVYGGAVTLANRWEPKQYCEPAMVDSEFVVGYSGDMEIRKKAISIVQDWLCPSGDVKQTRLYGAGGQFSVPADGNYLARPTEDWVMDITQNYREGDGAPSAVYPALVGPNASYPGGVANSNIAVSGSSEVIAENILRDAISRQIDAIANGAFDAGLDERLSRGWAGAGMWYNQIARLNGGLTTAAWNFPKVSRYPQIMEDVLAEVRQNNQNFSPVEQFNPNLGNDNWIRLQRDGATEAAIVLDFIYRDVWGSGASEKPTTGNLIYDFINWLFGTKGLFSLDDPQNAVANPLALMSSLGKSLVEASIRNLMFAAGADIASMGAAFAKNQVGEQASAAVSSFLYSISAVTLSAGIVLYYILPFLPFVYFFFAVGNWVKGVFEAIVGVPLWALAHLRIDGNGLPGEAAMNGYYMLFEIFLRPLLIVFGLLASVGIFQAMATVLNGIWPLATKNLSGTNYDLSASAGWLEVARGPVDQLFFTVMYAVILYIMALSSFKLIDLIPNQIMRWLGTGVSTFSDLTQDAAANLTQYSSIVSSQASSQVIGGMQQLGGAGRSVAKAAGSAND